jgi:hypothetical protein
MPLTTEAAGSAAKLLQVQAPELEDTYGVLILPDQVAQALVVVNPP